MVRYKAKKVNRRGGIVLAILISIVAVIVLVISFMPKIKNITTSYSTEVERYDSTIRKYARQYEMSEYVDLIKAVMMQESKGKGLDPMQSSESSYNTLYSKVPNGITDPEYSIECGIRYLKDSLDMAGSKGPEDLSAIKLAIQGYNYGHGYIPWAVDRDGGYTAENASLFSDKMALEMNWPRYGDKNYVTNVLRYYTHTA